MARLTFYWIDAFTETKLGGNPCAVVLESDNLSAETMQAVAKEMNLSETAFVRSSDRADFGARYFTPQGELPFAGHPTIATVHALVESGLIKKDRAQISLELPAGTIQITVSNIESRSQVTMTQLKPTFLKTYDRDEIASLYGISSKDLIADVPVQTVNTGSPILMVPIVSHEALRRVHYTDQARYLKLKKEGDFLFAHHFCLQGATLKGQTFARSLATPPYTLEDPFTGSATGCMAAYLWKYGLISNPEFVAEQGHWMNRPGEANVEVVVNAEEIQAVQVTGGAVTLIRGHIEI